MSKKNTNHSKSQGNRANLVKLMTFLMMKTFNNDCSVNQWNSGLRGAPEAQKGQSCNDWLIDLTLLNYFLSAITML